MTAPHVTISALAPQPAPLLREIHEDLRRAGVPCRPVELATAGSAKSGGSLTSLVVGGLVSAAGFRAMAQVLVAIVRRSGTRRIEVRRGDDVLVIDGASARDGRRALDEFLARPDDEA